MKVGIYFGEYSPDTGGAHTFVADVLDAVAAAAGSSPHSFVAFCTPATSDLLLKRELPSNFRVATFGKTTWLDRLATRLQYLSPVWRLAFHRAGKLERAATAEGVEMLWFVGVGVYESPDIPYIATIWDLQHRLQPYFPEISAKGLWDKRELVLGHFLRRAAVCVTGTSTGKDELQRFYQLPERSIRVIPLPAPRPKADAVPSDPQWRQRLGIPGKFILYPAQFWPHKNHVNLILAFRELVERHGQDLTLVLPGSDKGNLEFVKAFCTRQGMGSRVRFPGFVSAADRDALYREAEALAFVTYFGPDNLPPLEAFALGCPVVASAVDGAREQYGNAALLVDPSRPEDIAASLLRVLRDGNLRESLKAAGRERARQWIAPNYVEAIFGLIDEFATVRRNWR